MREPVHLSKTHTALEGVAPVPSSPTGLLRSPEACWEGADETEDVVNALCDSLKTYIILAKPIWSLRPKK